MATTKTSTGTAASGETLVSHALTTLAKAKDICDIATATTTYDTFLTKMINSATSAIENICGKRRFKSTTYTNERYDGNGADKLYLRHYPIISVSALTIDNESQSEATDYDDYDGHWIEPVIQGVKLEGCLYRVDKWNFGWQNVKITYTAGYATIPYDLDLACQLTVRGFYNIKKNSESKKSETIGRYSYTIDTLPASEQTKIMELLRNYIPVNYY